MTRKPAPVPKDLRTLFVADLHLEAERPRLTALFRAFLEGPARRCRGLYILGDLFEAWIGDDDDSPTGRQVVEGLRALADRGIPVSVLHGNRDFLLGDRFAEETGCTFIPDPSLCPVDGVPTLLTHGDLLCTADTDYLRFRAVVRDAVWQQEFLAKPTNERRAIGAALRKESIAATGQKDARVMDVDDAAVTDWMRRYGARRMIHGHTHRVGRHSLPELGPDAARIVLGDWSDDLGSVLVCAGGECRLTTWKGTGELA